MKPVLWFCLIALPTVAFCQESINIDSLSKFYTDRGWDLLYTDTDSSLYYLNRAISLTKNSTNEDIYYDALLGKIDLFEVMEDADSNKYYNELFTHLAFNNNASPRMKARMFTSNWKYLTAKYEFSQALEMLDSAKTITLQIKDSLFYGKILKNIGVVYEKMGKRDKSLEISLNALDVFNSLNALEEYGSTINDIAIAYKKAGDFENAMVYYNKSIKFHKDQKNASGEAVTRINRGLLFKDMGEYDKALNDLHFSLHEFQSENYTYAIMVSQHNLGETHLANNNPDSSLYYLNKSQELAEKFEYFGLIIKNNLALGKVSRKKGDINQSIQYATKAYKQAIAQNVLEDLKDINIILADNYADIGNYQMALQYFKEFKNTEDSLKNMESIMKLNLLRTEYDLEHKDAEIEALQAKNEIQAKLSKEQKKAFTLLVIGFVSTVVFFFVLFFLYRKQRSLTIKLNNQKALLIEQKEEIESAQEQIVQQNETLVKLNEEKDNLMAIVAHDLRSPLNQIRGVLGLVKMEKNSDSSNQLIDIANNSSEILSERINRILDIEAINAGKVNINLERLEVKKVLDFLQQNIHNVAIQKGMNLIIDHGDEVHCMADENYLLQVLENLCTNAIKYAPEKTEINISVKSEEKNILFAVKDQGPGIPEKEITTLFLPYSKTSNKPTGNESSTGLGLAIVKKYVEAMSGEVWVESETNKGSVFYVKLPKAA